MAPKSKSTKSQVEKYRSGDAVIESTLPQWMKKPENFLQTASFWQILWSYALEHLANIKKYKRSFNQNYDYIGEITGLLESETHYVSTHKATYSDDFQIITPDGQLWSQESLKKKEIENRRSVSRSKVVCNSDLCNGCRFKTQPKSTATVGRHTQKLLGIEWHCVNCGEVLALKSTLTTHSESCPYSDRVALENLNVGKQKAVKTARSKKKKPRNEHAILKPIIAKAEEKFVDFISVLTQRMKNDKLMAPSKNIDQIIIEIKRNFDYNFCEFFMQEIMLYETKIYEVTNYDDFYGIYYCNSKQKVCNDPERSVRFRILEINTGKVVSIHRLIKIRARIRNANMKKCDFKNCCCGNDYEVEEAEKLFGHILELNFLLVCDGCQRGYHDWATFQKHFVDGCFICRERLVVKPNATR